MGKELNGINGASQEMESEIRVQILNKTGFVLHCTNTLVKGMNPFVFRTAMGK